MKKNFNKFGWISFCTGIVLFAVTFFFFHFVTDSGITFVFQQEAGKPFVTNMLGVFATLFLWGGITSWMIGAIFCKKD